MYRDTQHDAEAFARDEIAKLSDNLEFVPDPTVPYVWLLLDVGAERAYILYLEDEDFEEADSWEEAIRYRIA